MAAYGYITYTQDCKKKIPLAYYHEIAITLGGGFRCLGLAWSCKSKLQNWFWFQGMHVEAPACIQWTPANQATLGGDQALSVLICGVATFQIASHDFCKVAWLQGWPHFTQGSSIAGVHCTAQCLYSCDCTDLAWLAWWQICFSH